MTPTGKMQYRLEFTEFPPRYASVKMCLNVRKKANN